MIEVKHPRRVQRSPRRVAVNRSAKARGRWAFLQALSIVLPLLFTVPVAAMNSRRTLEKKPIQLQNYTSVPTASPVQPNDRSHLAEEGSKRPFEPRSEEEKSPRQPQDVPRELDIALGIYTSGSLQTTAHELTQIDAWLEANGLSARLSIAGTFMDIEFPNPEWNIPRDLDAAWELGTIPFINLAVGTTDLGPRSASEVADGVIDAAIHRWARVYIAWSEGGSKWAYIAPLQEMNGHWTSYGLDPEGFRRAYRRIQAIFAEEGVPEGAVVWVFAPNGWSQPGHEFELYYPGDAYVDILAFSAFNFGACVPGGGVWDTFDLAIRPYIERLQAMAPEKPITLAQIGTTAEGGDKDAWLVDTFQGLAGYPSVTSVIYFNVAKPEAGGSACATVDWRLFDPTSGEGHQGFIEAIRALEADRAAERRSLLRIQIFGYASK